MEEGRDRPSERTLSLCAGIAGIAAMEEGRDRPSEEKFRRFPFRMPSGRNGGGPRSALGVSVEAKRVCGTSPAAMEEGRDRPSEALGQALSVDVLPAAMEEGRDRPSEETTAGAWGDDLRAAMEEGRDRPSECIVLMCSFVRPQAAMEEGRDRPSERKSSIVPSSTKSSRNGGGPRSALGET